MCVDQLLHFLRLLPVAFAMATEIPSVTVEGTAHVPARTATTLLAPSLEPAARPPTVSVQPPADASAAAKAHGPAPPVEQHGCRCNPGGRNLIVCIDGTSNQFSEKNTNVVELYSRLVKDDTQLTFYNSGIGTYATPSWKSLGYYAQQILNKLDLAFALRFERIIISAYAWIADNYQLGDRIFLFGFSRGAYQVRALSAMIDTMGIIHKGNDDQIPFAYELYAAGQKLPPTHIPHEGMMSPSSAATSAPMPALAPVAAPEGGPALDSAPQPAPRPTPEQRPAPVVPPTSPPPPSPFPLPPLPKAAPNPSPEPTPTPSSEPAPPPSPPPSPPSPFPLPPLPEIAPTPTPEPTPTPNSEPAQMTALTSTSAPAQTVTSTPMTMPPGIGQQPAVADSPDETSKSFCAMVRPIWRSAARAFRVAWRSIGRAVRVIWRSVERAFCVPSDARVDISRMQQRFKSSFSREAKVHFVGVWDTVSSVGITRSKTLPGTTNGMEHACYFRHALAIHEFRVKFLPEYVNGGLGPTRAGPFRGPSPVAPMSASQSPNAADSATATLPVEGESRRNYSQRSKEVWFSGSHSDIGGGATNNPNLDRFGPSLRWMSFEARVAGVRFTQEPQLYASHELDNTHSLTPIWKILEMLPFRRLTYQSAEEITRVPHLGSPRVFQKDQCLYWGVSTEDKTRFGLDGMEEEPDPYTNAQTFLDNLNRALAERDRLPEHVLSTLRESLRSLIQSDAGRQALRGVDPDSQIVRKLLAIFDIRVKTQDDLRDLVLSTLFGLVFDFDGTDAFKAGCDPQKAVAIFFERLGHRIVSVESLDKDEQDMLNVLRSTDPGRGALRKHSYKAVEAIRRILGFPEYQSTDLFDAITSILAIEGVACPVNPKSGTVDLTKCDVLAVGCGLLAILVTRMTAGTLLDLQAGEQDMLRVLRRVDASLIGPALDELNRLMLPWLLTLLRIYSAVLGTDAAQPTAKATAKEIVDDVQHIYDAFSFYISTETSEIRRLHKIYKPDSEDGEWTVPQILGHGNTVSSVLFLSPTKLASASWDGKICIWDILTGDNISPPISGHDAPINCLAACKNDHIVTGADDRTCIVWDSKTGEAVLRSQPLDQDVYAVACTCEGTKVAAGTDWGTVYLFDFVDSPIAVPLPTPIQGQRVFCLAFSPADPNILAVGMTDTTIVLWDLATQTPHLLREHTDWVRCLAFSPNGKYLASGSDDATIVVWSVQKKAVEKVIKTNSYDYVRSVAYSPGDGRYIVSSADNILRLWDSSTGEPVGTEMRGHRRTIRSVAWSPDGCRIASGADDDTIHIWDRVPFPRKDGGADARQ